MPTKRALIVGVNKYSNLDAESQLAGCVNDAKLIKSVLIDHFGFSESDVRELHDEAAGQKQILAEMERLVDDAQMDDIVVFHFSGHGMRRRARTLDEGIGKDCGIMPSDGGDYPNPSLSIYDNVINEWLGRLSNKTRYITLIFDCCFSGTVTRDSSGVRVRGVELSERGARETGDVESRRSSSLKKGPSGFLPLSDRYVVFAGCRDNEKAKEFNLDDGKRTTRNGALTYYLSRALIQAKPGSTYRDVYELARIGVTRKFPNQHPQIEGIQDREIFGVRDIEPMRFIPVASTRGELVTLNGGAAHGLHAHTQWTVYPQGTKHAEHAEPLAEIEIQEVGPLTSVAKVIQSFEEIPPAARCVETVPYAGHNPLIVDLANVPEDARAAIAARIETSRLLTSARASGAADIRAYVLESRTNASDDDPLPDSGAISTPSWALANLESKLTLPLIPVSQDDAVDTLIHNLETAARYRNALGLENPDSKLDVDFNIYRVRSDGELEPADDASFEFDEGDSLAFKVSNNEAHPVFVSILNFGTNGEINLLYPRRKANEMIAEGLSITKGSSGRNRVGLRNFSGDQGTMVFKAFIATDAVDFSWLRQGRTKSGKHSASGLGRRLESAFGGDDTRAGSEDGVEHDWMAINRSVVVNRKA